MKKVIFLLMVIIGLGFLPVNASGQLSVTELMPNPESGNEWVEIYNSGPALDLMGWTLVDKAGNSIALSGPINEGEYKQIEFSRSILNNTGEEILYLKEGGAEKSAVTYNDAISGQSYALIGGNWTWTASPTPGAANPEPQSQQSGQTTYLPLKFSEVLPDPEGSDSGEWFELFNPNQSAVNLENWEVADATSKMKLSGSIAAGSYLHFTSKVTLNNTGDSLTLRNPLGAVVAQLTFGKAAEGQSYALFGSDWKWTASPTPSAANKLRVAGPTGGTPASTEEEKSDESSQKIGAGRIDIVENNGNNMRAIGISLIVSTIIFFILAAVYYKYGGFNIGKLKNYFQKS